MSELLKELNHAYETKESLRMRLRHYTGQEIDMTLEELLEEINRDRSEDWLPFNQDDWLEGLDFTEYELVNVNEA